MLYRVTHTTKYMYSEQVPVCHNKVHLAPRNTAHQNCNDYRLTIHPEPAFRGVHYDFFGNRVDYFCIQDASRNLTVTATSHVDVAGQPRPQQDDPPAWEEIRDRLARPKSNEDFEACLYTTASEFVRCDPAFADYARPSFSSGRHVLEASRDLMTRIHKEFSYDTRATNISTPVEEVLEKKAGVCQDFAHLQISCLRSLGLAARYVSGYLRTVPPPGRPRLEGADASHAWLSVYCGSLGWVDIDPTNDVITETDHVTLGFGRDYGDVCPIQGVFVGGGDHSMSVSVDVLPL